MKIRLSDHFTCRRLLRFTLPSIVMMIFTSIYGVVDGLFVSNFVGKTPFAAINLIMPFLMAFGALGFMIGTGGSALVAKTLGEGKQERANALFSMLIGVTLALGVAVAAVGMPLLRPAARALGAQGAMLEDCVRYGGILLPATAAFMLQNVFQSFFITAERPRLGLMVTVAAGVTNMCWTRCSSQGSDGGWRARRWPQSSASWWAGCFRWRTSCRPTRACCDFAALRGICVRWAEYA